MIVRRSTSPTSRAAATPSGTPSSTVSASSAITTRLPPSRLRPRSRARATSGRRCSTAAFATSASTVTASRASWASSSGTRVRTMARPDEIDATRSGTGVETLTPSLARSRPASAALIRGTVANDTRERSSGYSTDTAACDHPSAKVFSTVRKSSTAGTIEIPRGSGKPDLPSTLVRSQ